MIKILIILSMIVNVNDIVNPCHTDLFQSTDRLLMVRGGANAGKSYSVADKLLLQSYLQKDRNLKSVVIRKTFPSLRSSALEILIKRAEKLHLTFKLNKSDWEAQCRKHKFLFRSLNNEDDYKKIKSMTDVDYIWLNEINELRENDVKVLDTRMRGGEGKFKQLVGDFNPVSKYHWLYDMIYGGSYKIRELKYTIRDNPWASKEEIEALERTRYSDPNFYKIYFDGEWGELEGVIYNWDVVSLPDIAFDDIFYALDFGYSVAPAALVRIYRKADEYWIEELIYQIKLTNRDLASRMHDFAVGDSVVYCDSAEPKSIDELCEEGINAQPSIKGPDSVRHGIDYCQSVKIHIIDGSVNIIKEARGYVWVKDKDGRINPNKPIKYNDHGMDSVRYGIHTDHLLYGGDMSVAVI